ncbi:hypothetical protein HID58_079699, partial [Brassica napus]
APQIYSEADTLRNLKAILARGLKIKKTFFCFIGSFFNQISQTRNIDIAHPELSPYQNCIKSYGCIIITFSEFLLSFVLWISHWMSQKILFSVDMHSHRVRRSVLSISSYHKTTKKPHPMWIYILVPDGNSVRPYQSTRTQGRVNSMYKNFECYYGYSDIINGQGIINAYFKLDCSLRISNALYFFQDESKSRSFSNLLTKNHLRIIFTSPLKNFTMD